MIYLTDTSATPEFAHSNRIHTKPVSKAPDIAGAVRLMKKSRDQCSSGVPKIEDNTTSTWTSDCCRACFDDRTTSDDFFGTLLVGGGA
jgi:hypothetical protein